MIDKKQIKKIAVFTSGGDAPGMNAAIRAVVRGALYYKIDVFGVLRGYEGMIAGQVIPLNGLSVSNIIQRGGTILKSATLIPFFHIGLPKLATIKQLL